MKHGIEKKTWLNWLVITVFCFLLLYALTLIIPIFWAVFTSLKSVNEYKLLNRIVGFPNEITFENYKLAYEHLYVSVQTGGMDREVRMLEMFGNSLLYSTICMLASTFTPCLVAYVTARYRYKFGKVVYAIVIITISLPIVGSLPSEIQMSKALGLFDTFLGMGIMKCSFIGVYYLVFYAQFKMIPKDYTEAATIDGASDFRIMLEVILPLAWSTISTVALLTFISFWNDYQIPLIYLRSHPVAAVGMYEFLISTITYISWTPRKMAGAILMAIPIIVIFLIFQKKLMVNLSVGGIKG